LREKNLALKLVMSSFFAILFRVLEILFFLGIAGSVVVIAITTVQDMGLLFEEDEPSGTTALNQSEAHPGPFVPGSEHI
jgi:hypothetical protein